MNLDTKIGDITKIGDLYIYQISPVNNSYTYLIMITDIYDSKEYSPIDGLTTTVRFIKYDILNDKRKIEPYRLDAWLSFLKRGNIKLVSRI